MWRVLIACRLPPAVVARFEATFRIRAFDARQTLADQAVGCDAIVASVETPLTATTIAALPDTVHALATYSVGTDHIDLQAVASRGLALVNTPDVLSRSVAETAVLLALGASRRATESIALLRSGDWAGWTSSQLIGWELAGKTAGILGMGSIGREIAGRLRAFDMTIAYHNCSRLPIDLEGGAAYHSTADGLLAAADLLIIAAPATAATSGFLNAERIARMKDGAIVVNIARGSLVVDGDLIEALASSRIRAAGLDVFDNEPRIDRRYFDLPNVFMLPHIGSSTVEARLAMGETLIAGLLALRRGERPPNMVST